MKNQTLIDGILNQESKVYSWIYSSWYSAVEAMVKKNSGTIADAQDLFQNAMLELYLNLKTGKFKEQEKPLKNYFLMICLNKWRNHLRQNYKQRTAALQNADLETDDYTEAILFKEGLLDLIEVYLDKMTDSCKAMLKAFYYAKKGLKTIAEENTWTLKYTKKKNYSCRQKLKEAIENDKQYKQLVR